MGDQPSKSRLHEGEDITLRSYRAANPRLGQGSGGGGGGGVKPRTNPALNQQLNDCARNTNDTKYLRRLVEQGADLTSTNGAPWHHTPMHQSAYHNRPQMVSTLIELCEARGVLAQVLSMSSNPCGRGGRGTPLDLARGGRHQKCADLLAKAAKGAASVAGSTRGNVAGSTRGNRQSKKSKQSKQGGASPDELNEFGEQAVDFAGEVAAHVIGHEIPDPVLKGVKIAGQAAKNAAICADKHHQWVKAMDRERNKNQRVEMASRGGRAMRVMRARRRILSARLVNVHAGRCTAGVHWGYDGCILWVTGGLRATFDVTLGDVVGRNEAGGDAWYSYREEGFPDNSTAP